MSLVADGELMGACPKCGAKPTTLRFNMHWKVYHVLLDGSVRSCGISRNQAHKLLEGVGK